MAKPNGLYRRRKGGNWYCDIVGADGRRARLSLGTTDLALAQKEYARIRERAWADKRGGTPDYLWEEAETRWLREQTAKGKRSLKTDKSLLDWWRPKLDGMTLRQIDYDLVKAEVENAIVGRKWSPATANRHAAIVRAILNCAGSGEWKWLPLGKVTMPKWKEADRRVRDLPGETVAAMLADPALPAHQRDMIALALATGLRQGNVRRLQWSWLDLDRSCGVIPRVEFKAKRDHGFPLNADAMSILQRWKGVHPTFVFAYRGEPIKNPNSTAWRALLKRHGVTDFRWHDLRHVWASALARQGVPDGTLMELAGWSSASMAQRYAHLNVDHLKGIAARIEGLGAVPTKPSAG